MDFSSILDNFLHPPVLFFFLGLIAVAVRSDLEVPPQIAKFLTLYLLFHIGVKGGEELFHSGISLEAAKVILACTVLSFGLPFISFFVLRTRLDDYNAGAIAASYGSISAVTFAAATSFLEGMEVDFGGYMVAGMAFMESPAIIAGLILINKFTKNDGVNELKGDQAGGMSNILREAFLNGSVLLLMGSLVIGYVSGETGEKELAPFVDSIFKGMLSIYMLDMGLLAGRRMNELRKSGVFLISFAAIYPPLLSFLAIGIAYLLNLQTGDALLFTVLVSSASYIAVPAAMRMAVPQANMGLMLPMSLGVTFTFNIALGIPFYHFLITYFW